QLGLAHRLATAGDVHGFGRGLHDDHLGVADGREQFQSGAQIHAADDSRRPMSRRTNGLVIRDSYVADMSIVSVSALVDALEFDSVSGSTLRGHNVHSNHGVVFGGQLLGQSVVAAAGAVDGMTVKTLHTSFS